MPKATKAQYLVHDLRDGTSDELKQYVNGFLASKKIPRTISGFEREISGTRRFTADRIEHLIAIGIESPAEQQRLWNLYFSGENEFNYFEMVRRAVIQKGGFYPFCEKTESSNKEGIDHTSLGTILQGVPPSYRAHKLIANHLFASREQVNDWWRKARFEMYVDDEALTPLAAHMEMLLDENETSVRQWTETTHPLPKGIAHFSKNTLKKIFALMRKDFPVPWSVVEDFSHAFIRPSPDKTVEAQNMFARQGIAVSWAHLVRQRGDIDGPLFVDSLSAKPVSSEDPDEAAIQRGVRELVQFVLHAPGMEALTKHALLTGDIQVDGTKTAEPKIFTPLSGDQKGIMERIISPPPPSTGVRTPRKSRAKDPAAKVQSTAQVTALQASPVLPDPLLNGAVAHERKDSPENEVLADRLYQVFISGKKVIDCTELVDLHTLCAEVIADPTRVDELIEHTKIRFPVGVSRPKKAVRIFRRAMVRAELRRIIKRILPTVLKFGEEVPAEEILPQSVLTEQP